MKKIILTVLPIILLIPLFVFAFEDDSEQYYYTNLRGVSLTKEQYNNLKKAFNEDTIATMTKEAINLLKNDKNLKTETEFKFYQTDTYYDVNNEIIKTEEKEISEEAMNNYISSGESEIMPLERTRHETNMKILSISVTTGSSASTKIVTLHNTWKSIPSVKSYDVIAIRTSASSKVINPFNDMISGYQKWDGNYVYYDGNSENTRVLDSFTKAGEGGVGVSMNIVDSVKNSLENELQVIFLCGADPFEAFGSYQHTQKDLTLKESQKYKLNANGYGSVIDFDSSVRSYYDTMGGVSKIWRGTDFFSL